MISFSNERLDPEVNVRTTKTEPLMGFLTYNGYSVEQDATNPRLFLVKETSERPPIWLVIGDASLHFECFVGSIAEMAGDDTAAFLQSMLNLNYEILPVSLAINDEQEVVLVESRERENLDSNELLAVFDAIEIAYTKLANFLAKQK